MITFEVSPVDANRTPIDLDSTAATAAAIAREHDGVARGYAVNAARAGRSDWHPFVMAAHLAFDRHYPLSFAPDDVWALICAGIARHLDAVDAGSASAGGEGARHPGAAVRTLMRDDFDHTAPDGWDEVAARLASQIRSDAGLASAVGGRRFSTTGAIEDVGTSILLTDAVQRYFSFSAMTRCGIPRVTLLGSSDDWEALRERLRPIRTFDLDWWLDPLDDVLSRIAGAARGRVDRPFWQSLVKLREESGGGDVTGWINVLFPYLDRDDHDPAGESTASAANRFLSFREAPGRSFRQEAGSARRGPTPGPEVGAFGTGLSRVPVRLQQQETYIAMDLVGGFVGISQGDDGALRPALGWVMLERTGQPGGQV